MSNNTIIIENKILYSLLKEIENSLNLNIENSTNSIIGNINSTDYLLFDIKKINLPIKIENLVEKINIQFLKEKYKNQSNIKISKYLLNLNSRTLNLNDKKLKLTEKEVNIILFLKIDDRSKSISELQDKVWGYSSNLETHTVETHIYRLRKKIYDAFKDDALILNDKNGYKIL